MSGAAVEIVTPRESCREAARRFSAAKLREGFKPEALHHWRHADGTVRYFRIRLKRPETGEKWLRPFYLNGEGAYVLGEPPAPEAGKLLYRLPELVASDAAVPVFIAEGEKCADALAELGLIATTSGSCSSAAGADWTPLKGRHCVVWPDNDAPGLKYAHAVAECLRHLDCDVRVLDSSVVEALPEHGDAVDWLRETPDATAAEVLALPTVVAKHATTISTEPRPLPSPLPDVPAFDSALLPESVCAWCEDAAEGLQVPLDFTAIPVIVAMAGVIGRRVGIRLKRNEHWLERPMLWGCVVGRPSSGKSPALSPARRMLERLADAERSDYESALAEHEARAMVAEANKSNAKDTIRKALKNGDKRAAETAALEAQFNVNAPTEPRILVNDATVEKLGVLLNENANGLLQYRDELAGWLASLDREGHEGYRAFWLECWNGSGTFTVDRIGRGTVHIECCAMSILGGMQPGKLAEYVRGAVRGGFADDGLIQRFQLAVYPDLPNGWRYTDRAPSPGAEVRAWETFKRLRALDPDSIGAERAEWADVPFIRFDGEAQGLFIEWLTDLMGRLRAGDEPPWMESHLAKYPGLSGRLALVLHLADGNTGAVSAETLARALNWCEYLEGHARRIYAPATDNGLTGAHLLLKRRADLGERFTARDVYRRQWTGLPDPDAVADALDILIEHGHLQEIDPEPGTNGRPSITYAWRGA